MEGNLELSDVAEWAEVFSTTVSNPILVARAGVLTAGRTYAFSLTATDSFGGAGYAGKHAFVWIERNRLEH